MTAPLKNQAMHIACAVLCCAALCDAVILQGPGFSVQVANRVLSIKHLLTVPCLPLCCAVLCCAVVRASCARRFVGQLGLPCRIRCAKLAIFSEHKRYSCMVVTARA